MGVLFGKKKLCSFFASLSPYGRDVLFQASGNVVGQVIGLLGIPILSRLYSPEAFAMQSIFLQLVMLIAGVVTWRYEYLFQLLDNTWQAKRLFNWLLSFGFFITVVLTAVLFWKKREISSLVGFSIIEDYIFFAPVTAFLVSISLAIQHDFQRERDFSSSGKSEAVGKASYIIGGIIASVFGAVGLLLTTAFSSLGKIVFLLGKMIRRFRNCSQAGDCATHPRRLLKGSANGMVLSHFFATVTGLAPVLFIGSTYGAEALGQFSLVTSTIFLPSGMVGMAIGQVFYQRAAKASPIEVEILWRKTIKRLMFIGAPIFITVALVSGFMYPIVFGGQWRLAGEVGQIFSVAAFCSFLSSPLDRISYAMRIPWYNPAWHFLRLVTTISVLLCARSFGLDFYDFLIVLVVQISLLYIFDLGAGYVLVKMSIRSQLRV